MIAEAMYVLRPVFYTRQTDWRQAKGMRKGELPSRAEEEISGELARIESRIFHTPLRRLCEAVETEEASFIIGEATGLPESDKRQDTPFKALPATGFTDTGRQDRGDKRRDTPAKG